MGIGRKGGKDGRGRKPRGGKVCGERRSEGVKREEKRERKKVEKGERKVGKRWKRKKGKADKERTRGGMWSETDEGDGIKERGKEEESVKEEGSVRGG